MCPAAMRCHRGGEKPRGDSGNGEKPEKGEMPQDGSGNGEFPRNGNDQQGGQTQS